MKLKLMGKKRGMTQLFDTAGHLIVCTVIEVEPNVITQIKTVETDGYQAVQTGFEKVKEGNQAAQQKRLGKPIFGKYQKAGVEPRRHLAETRVEAIEGFQVGEEYGVDSYKDVNYVDVTSTSIGKGFQGAMKRYGFAGGAAAHGSGFHRAIGSTGCRNPGLNRLNQKRAGHMGAERVTIQNLKVMEVDAENRLLIVKGAVPGPKNAVITVKPAVKKTV